MVGRALLSAVACGLLLGVGLNEPLEASQDSSTREPQQDQAETLDPEALRLAAEQGDAGAPSELGDTDTDGAATVRSHRLADRVIDPSCYCRIHPDRPGILRVIQEIGRLADLPMGIEALPDPFPDRSRRLDPDYVTYAGMTVGEALDLAIELDGHRYRWLETRGMIIVRPVMAWMDKEHYLRDVHGNFVLEDQMLNEAAWEMYRFIGAEPPHLEPSPIVVTDVRLTFTLAGASLFDALNGVVQTHGGVFWSVSYWWCASAPERWRIGWPRWRWCPSWAGDGDVWFTAQIILHEGKGAGFSARVPNQVDVPETAVHWPFWAR